MEQLEMEQLEQEIRELRVLIGKEEYQCSVPTKFSSVVKKRVEEEFSNEYDIKFDKSSDKDEINITVSKKNNNKEKYECLLRVATPNKVNIMQTVIEVYLQ